MPLFVKLECHGLLSHLHNLLFEWDVGAQGYAVAAVEELPLDLGDVLSGRLVVQGGHPVLLELVLELVHVRHLLLYFLQPVPRIRVHLRLRGCILLLLVLELAIDI